MQDNQSTQYLEFKRNNRSAPFRYTFFMRNTSNTFEFTSFIPMEPNPAVFEIPDICVQVSGSTTQQMFSSLLVAICMCIYFSILP